MELRRALGLVLPGEVIALVGAGGKTTALYLLARELTAAGYCGILTTTTKIRIPTAEQVPQLVVSDRLPELQAEVGAALARGPLVAVGAARGPEGKLHGIDPTWVGMLRQSSSADFVLVEADGAAGRPLKGPASHEPVIPETSTLVVPVVGASALGKPLSADTAHRPEIVARLSGLSLGDSITPEAVACLVLHPEGNTRGAPPSARVVPLINQVDTAAHAALARQVASRLLARGLGRVVIAHLAASPPSVEIMAALVSPTGDTR